MTDALAIKPRRRSMEEAASVPLAGLTAWQALIERATLQKGQKVLIHAGSGGVGTFAILAKHVGATVATTTSTANVDLVKANRGQLREITSLIDAGTIRPVVDRIFPFDATKEALAYVETGRAKGKVVVRVSGA
jgi:NADPH:quinone reductase-like Zn-dependent oxidoreductase